MSYLWIPAIVFKEVLSHPHHTFGAGYLPAVPASFKKCRWLVGILSFFLVCYGHLQYGPALKAPVNLVKFNQPRIFLLPAAKPGTDNIKRMVCVERKAVPGFILNARIFHGREIADAMTEARHTVKVSLLFSLCGRQCRDHHQPGQDKYFSHNIL